MTEPVRRSPLGRIHTDLGATLAREDAWELPVSYGDETEERRRLREAVAVADVTPRAKVDVRGAIDAPLATGHDGLTARIADDWALVLGAPGGEDRLLAGLEPHAGTAAMVTDATHLYAGIAIGGPELSRVLERLTTWDASTLAPGAATGAPIADLSSVVVRRDLPVPLLEVYVPTEVARYAWETIASVVTRLGGGPAGWSALRAEGWG